MILELVGSRVLAPYLGTSIFVWTSLIGIILGSLSLGYYYGGQIADKYPNYKVFSVIIFSAGIYIGLSNILKLPFLESLRIIPDLRVSSSLAALVLFAFPSVLLGMVSPYAAKLKVKDLNKAGATVGALYAISTIGSIFGTFLAGFFLIAYLGSTNIIFVLSLVLILVSLFAYPKSFLKTKLSLFLIFALFIPTANFVQAMAENIGFFSFDTLYNKVIIYDDIDYNTQKPIRRMGVSEQGDSSAMFLDSDELVYPYTRFYRLAPHFNPNIKKSLMIGGAAYSYPKDYLAKFKNAAIDVVEIDPALTDLAREYFNLKDNPRLNIYHSDGRMFLNKTKNKYDAIFLDAFHGHTIPYQLATKEAVQKIFNALNKDGVLLANLITSIEGEKGKFLRAEYATYKSIFPQVYLFPVHYKDGRKRQNIMLAALKSEKPPLFENNNQELNQYLSRLWTKEIPIDMPILTDDYAPVDSYIKEIFKR